MAVKVLLVDLGNVLIRLNHASTEAEWKKLGTDMKETGFLRQLHDLETGKINEAEFYHRLSLKNPPGKKEMDRLWNGYLGEEIPGRLEIFRSLAEKFPLYLISNTCSLHIREMCRRYGKTYPGENLFPFFRKEYYSYRLGVAKPDPALWNILLDEIKSTPEETLLIDDNPQNIASARQKKMQTLALQPNEDLPTALRLFDLL